jgi:hypothetical protein
MNTDESCFLMWPAAVAGSDKPVAAFFAKRTPRSGSERWVRLKVNRVVSRTKHSS